MTVFRDLRIGVRLGAAFVAVLLLMVATLALAGWTMAGMHARTEHIAVTEYRKVALVGAALDNVRGSIGRVMQIVGDTSPERLAKARERLEVNIKAFDDAMAELKPLLDDAEAVTLFDKAEATRQRYKREVAEVFKTVENADEGAAAAQLFGVTYESLHAFAGALRELQTFSQTAMKEATAEDAAAYDRARVMMVVAALIALATGALLAWLITRSITVPLNAAVAVADRVAAGDLSSRIPEGGRDETGRLLTALSRMNAALVQLVGELRGAADSIATSSAEIATGNADLSRRTESQASSLQQTAASMEELASTVRSNAETAGEAARLAAETSTGAGAGGEAMQRVVATMQAIGSSSQRIGDIIGTIDGIAFQTNILALNAAVEAARAGEQGRGFAVVAGEVRLLAQRSAEAAREIKTLIGQSRDTVESGNRLVADAGERITTIVAQVERVSTLVGEIGNASAEQRSGIDQVGQAVTTLDDVTQQNAALVEQSAAAADSLRRQAEALQTLVARFRLEAA
ncbi:methyl-accepting chemotaxis protein [Rubrivivax sp. JA1026]|uniref:methyl-accepting chemotaxis protein n=1 Tax=Rubrivivax sp. JA1026 TaxID=2710888 RepID=UPI0013E947D8|nr:methyl-accepting chemotaxis protein [Rubrivivax sp. JA1026]